MSRSKWKGLFSNLKTLQLKKKLKKSKNLVRVWSRSSAIPKFFVTKKAGVYNGKYFKRVWVSTDKMGFKFYFNFFN